MYKIKMIAPKDLIAPLAILGLETYPAHDEAEAGAALDQAAKRQEPSLIFVTETLASGLDEQISKLNRRPGTNIVLIPDNRGSTGLAAAQIQNLVKNSIGAEVVIRK